MSTLHSHGQQPTERVEERHWLEQGVCGTLPIYFRISKLSVIDAWLLIRRYLITPLADQIPFRAKGQNL